MFAYLITDSTHCLESKLQNAFLKLRPLDIELKYACLRYDNVREDSKMTIKNIESFVYICKNFHITPLFNLSFNILEIAKILNNNLKLGIHLKDSNLGLLDSKNLTHFSPKIYSAHNIESIITALDKNADFVTISPIYYDKYNKALGVSYLQNLDSKIKKHCIALGGINTESKILNIAKTHIAGFASISYFKKFCL